MSAPTDELDGVEVLAFADAAEWGAWLAANHRRDDGVWLKAGEAGIGHRAVTSDEVVAAALARNQRAKTAFAALDRDERQARTS